MCNIMILVIINKNTGGKIMSKKNKENNGPLEINIPMEMEVEKSDEADFIKNNVEKSDVKSDGLDELKDIVKGKTSIPKLMKEKTCSLLESGVPEENRSGEIRKSFKKIAKIFVNDLKKSGSEISELRIERFCKLVFTEISEGSDYVGMFLKEFPMLSKDTMFSLADVMVIASLQIYPEQPKIDLVVIGEELKKIIPSPNKQECA